MIEISLVLTAVLTPQIVPSAAEAVLLGSSTVNGELQLSRLGLGDGGVRQIKAVRVGRRPLVAGFAETAGGVRLSAKKPGVKLTFASGRELLVTPGAQIHLRSGEKTLPFFGGVRLCLADGAEVTIWRGASARRPLASVAVEEHGRTRTIWSGARRVVQASHSKAFRGSILLALGDGGVLYRASGAGPVIALQRVLCPRDQVHRWPVRRLLIVGDVLARSLQLLPDHAPQKSAQFPQVAEAARRFAALSPLFRRHVARLPGAVGELWFSLADQYRLRISNSDRDVITIGLYRGSSMTPGLEWIVATRTTLHFLRPDGGARGGPRYFMRGIDLREMVDGLLPIPASARFRSQICRVMTALGGRESKPLKMRHRSRRG